MNRRAYLSTFGATGLIIVLTLATSVLIARNIGPEGRGALLAITIWPALLINFMGLGINEATIYHVAHSSVKAGTDGPAGFAASGLVLQIAVAAVATLVTLALLPLLVTGTYAAWLGVVMLYAATYGPLVTLDQHMKAVLQGQGHYHALSIVRMGQPLVYAGLLLGLYLAHRLSVETVLAAMVASNAVSVVSGAAFAGLGLTGASAAGIRQTLKTGLRYHVGNMLTFAATEADKLIVLGMLDVTAAGYYAVAVALSPLGMVAVVQSLGIVLSREMARCTNPEERAGVFARNLLTATVMLLAVNGFAAAFAFWWLPLLYGQSFAGAVSVTATLLIMGAVKGLRQITDRAMRSMHNASVGIAGEVVALALTVAFAFAGAHLGGLEGLAWGLVFAQLIALIVMLSLAVRTIGVRPADFAERLLSDALHMPDLLRREAVLLRERFR